VTGATATVGADSNRSCKSAPRALAACLL